VNAPDLSQKVLGFREFQILDGGLAATGVGSVHWLPGCNRARCLARHLENGYSQWNLPMFATGNPPEPPKPKSRHPAPATGCNCGLYGLHKPKEQWVDGSMIENPKLVPAAILGWGRMEVHRSGFRAEYAEIALLAYDPLVGLKAMRRIVRVAKRFGVRAVDIEEFAAEAYKLGHVVPEALLPNEKLPQHLPVVLPPPSAYLSPVVMGWGDSSVDRGAEEAPSESSAGEPDSVSRRWWRFGR